MPPRKPSITTGTTLKIWRILEKVAEESNIPPTLREVSAQCDGISISTVSRHLEKLERAQVIQRRPNSSRGITLLRKSNGRAMR